MEVLIARIIHHFAILAGSATAVVFAEPTELSLRTGSFVAVAGLLLWVLASATDDAAPPDERGGFYNYCRHPFHLAGFLLAAGAVIAAASEGKDGRWVPRLVAPAGLLYFFCEALPRAELALRERIPPLSQAWFQQVPALVPSFRSGSRGARATYAFSRIFTFDRIYPIGLLAAVFAALLLEYSGILTFKIYNN